MLKLVRVGIRSAVARLSEVDTQVQCRWAGHSKWQNIKHQKAASDLEKNKLFTRLTRMLKVAISEGKDSDPETNYRLASVVGQCRRANMPQSNITNAIKSATTKSEDKTVILQIRGPGRCAIIVEAATSANPALIKNSVAALMKKHACKYESVAHDFVEKGVLVASPLPNSANPVEDATDHAIEAGVEDVTYDEGTKKLRFEVTSSGTWKAKKALEGFGYVFDTAIVEQMPNILAELSDQELELVQKFLAKVEAIPEVMQVTDNIA